MQLTVIFTLAWRNLWRNYRRTLIMLLAIVIGVWAMIFMTAMMRGMVDDVIENGIRNLPGHAQAFHPDFLDDPNIENTIPALSNTLAQQLNSPEIVAWAMRLKIPAAISSEREVRGIQLLGVQAKKEANIAFDTGQVVEGRWLESDSDKGIVIGAKLAERLETRLGKRVVIMSQDTNNEIAERGFRIVGIYKSKDVALLEELNVFAGLSTIQTLLKAENQISQVAFEGKDYRNSAPLLRVLQQSDLSAMQNVALKPWYEIDSYLGTMLGVMDGFVLIWILVIFLALSFGLVNTLVMAVFERVREIGLMQALGMKSRLILLQIICEAFLLLVLGLVFGNALALLSILPFASGIDVSGVAQGLEMMGANSVLYPALYLKDVVTANAVVIVLGVLASLLPAWRAASYDPIVALNKT
ncbi:ABC-type transport system, involved in lipoprotein release, permease component [Alteromonadaceae bacterium Bs31]|nr:ABC-type transport system, involved in lipoprotein release, permease component [Alteromonadaceae bacterium Bs31]